MSLKIDKKKCDQCGTCISVCSADALVLVNELDVDNTKCILCRKCIQVCPVGALTSD